MSGGLFDTHCHLDFVGDEAGRAEVVARAAAAGVARILVPGVGPAEWAALGALKALPGVSVAVGVHPEMLPRLGGDALRAALGDLGARARELGAVAIGECGLDGNVEKAGVPMGEQTRVLGAHLDVAEALGLPVVLHIFRCHGAALAYLKARGALLHGGVVHSYSGSAELVREYVGLNLHVSFAGAITRPNAERPVKALRAVPADRLLLETDAPDQLPSGVEARQTEPAHLVAVVEAAARHLGEAADVVGARAAANAERLFGVMV